MADTWLGTNAAGENVYLLPSGQFAVGSDAGGWRTQASNPLAGSAAAAPRNTSQFIDPGVAASQGYRSPNYHGSYEEWLYRASRTLAERYMRGEDVVGALGGSLGSIGQPDRSDFSSGSNGNTGHVSYQTYDFFENYLRQYGSSDPYITTQFGGPPSSSANWEDPTEKIQGTFADRTAADLARDAANNASNERIAAGHDAASIQAAQIGAQASNYAADKQYAGVVARVEGDWKIATLQDATQRYIAEGNWGTQKYIAQLQEQGALDRLKLELGQRDKELAQAATNERNRHHESMVALTLEVAKYDQQLASQPRNWLAYAAWLQNRGAVVNGLNLAMAAQVVPEDAISPAEVANNPGAVAAGGAIASALQAQTAATGGTSQNIAPAPTANTTQPAQGAQGNTLASQGTPEQQQQIASGQQYSVAGVDLNNTDYTALANQLLGLGPNGGAPPTTEQLQATYDSVNPAGKQVSSFGAWGGPTTNSLGVTVNPLGQKNDFRKFAKLLPGQQDMNIAGASSVGKPEEDYVGEMVRSRPKGITRGAVAYG